MPRLKPPPSRLAVDLEDNTPPTEAIEIALPGDEPAETEVDLAPSPPEKKVEPEPEAPLVEENPLQKQLDAQRRAEELQRTEHQRQMRERDEELARERSRGDDAEYNSVLTAIAAEQATLDKAEADYAAFAHAGDFGNAARAQRIMSVASARLDRLEDGKQSFEQKREALKKEPPKPTPQASAPLDFEQRIAQMPESAKSWLRKHPEFINDTALNDKIGSAHQYLTKNRGVEAFSTAYFDALDDEFGFKAAPQVDPVVQPQRRSMPVSAPVSRDVPTANGHRQPTSKVTLSQEERLIARTSFTSDMTNEQKELLYARNKAKLARQRASGEYRQTTEQNG